MNPSATPVARGAPAMTSDQLDVLRTMLGQQRRFRLDQIEQLRRSDRRGRLSAVDDEIGRSLLAGARAALRDVRQALDRMADGSYGSCRQCGAKLAVERLEVLPQVSLCMPCQRDAELG